MNVVSLIAESVIREILEVASRTPFGAFCEVGVYQGGSAYFLAELAEREGRPLYLYDTFTGMPFKGDLDPHNVGDFSDTSLEDVQQLIPYATIIKGVFPASAVPMSRIAFAHLDCDQYQSYIASCQYLEPLMVPGGVMWFDDYRCLQGATTAVDELYGGRLLPTRGTQVMVKF